MNDLKIKVLEGYLKKDIKDIKYNIILENPEKGSVFILLLDVQSYIKVFDYWVEDFASNIVYKNVTQEYIEGYRKKKFILDELKSLINYDNTYTIDDWKEIKQQLGIEISIINSYIEELEKSM